MLSNIRPNSVGGGGVGCWGVLNWDFSSIESWSIEFLDCFLHDSIVSSDTIY